MYTTHVGITGNNTLATINQIINERENLNCEFQDNDVGFDDDAVVNQVTLKLYDAGTVPNKLTLKKKSEPALADTAKVWEGVMMARNNLVVVIAYRDV